MTYEFFILKKKTEQHCLSSWTRQSLYIPSDYADEGNFRLLQFKWTEVSYFEEFIPKPSLFFSFNQLTGPIQSLSPNVHQLSVCVFVVTIAENCFPVDLRLLVEERIANIGKALEMFGFLLLL